MAAILPGSDVTVHVEPLSSRSRKDENPFSLVQRTASEHGLAVHNVHVLRTGALFHIELHVELPGTQPFAEAYARVRPFEEDLRQALPGAEVVSHLEPEGAASALHAAALAQACADAYTACGLLALALIPVVALQRVFR